MRLGAGIVIWKKVSFSSENVYGAKQISDVIVIVWI